jgi:hypothetical protein
MPVSVIFENLDAGANIDDIMEWFEGLDREQIKAVIEFCRPQSRRGPLCLQALMLVLFDQGTPVPIRPFLIGHTLETAAQRGCTKIVQNRLLAAKLRAHALAREKDKPPYAHWDKNHEHAYTTIPRPPTARIAYFKPMSG